MGAIIKFVFYAFKPLSKTVDIWDAKDFVQAIILVFGWGGGGGGVWLMTNNTEFATVLLAGIPAFLFLVAGIKLQWRLDKLNRKPKEHIVFKRTDNVPWTDKGDPYFVRAYFANDPPEPQFGKDAHNVSAEISFYLPNREKHFAMNGRWAGYEELASGGKASASEQITLPSNGRAEPLDIGLKYHSEKEFYAYDNTTQAKGILGWRDKDKKLTNREYFVKVIIRGSDGVYASFWFSLRNDGVGKKVDFSLLSSEPDFHKEGSQT